MKFLITALIGLTTTLAHAGPKSFPGLNFVDKEGQAVLVRDGQNAALIVIEDAAKELKRLIPQFDPAAAVKCEANYCVVGQLSRDGSVSALDAKFAEQIRKAMAAYTNPQSLSDLDLFEYGAGKTFAMASQCQDEKLRQIPEVELNLSRVAAEKLYNYLLVPDNRNERPIGNAKMGAGDFIFCEKLPQYDSADVSRRTGQSLPGVSPSYIEYNCWLKFGKTGLPAKRGQCHIYGGSFSAGGGGGG